jgi:Arc/MetJ family transcription regulator
LADGDVEGKARVANIGSNVYIWPLSYTLEAALRTNIDIDDKLMSEAMELSGARTKKQTVEEALRDMVRRRKAAKAILALRGKVEWEGDPDALRRDK